MSHDRPCDEQRSVRPCNSDLDVASIKSNQTKRGLNLHSSFHRVKLYVLRSIVQVLQIARNSNAPLVSHFPPHSFRYRHSLKILLRDEAASQRCAQT